MANCPICGNQIKFGKGELILLGPTFTVCDECANKWSSVKENKCDYKELITDKTDQEVIYALEERFTGTSEKMVREQEKTDRRKSIIATTTNDIRGYEIVDYKEVVSGQIVIADGLLGLITSGTFFTVSALDKAINEAIEILKDKAVDIGGNAVIGIDIDILDWNRDHGKLVSANGTVVTIRKKVAD